MGRTPKQVQDEQRKLAESDRQRRAAQAQPLQQRQPQQQQQLVPMSPAPPPAPVSAEALERHLADWGGSAGRLLAFNGSTGVHRVLGDDVEIPAGSKFIAGLDQTQRGYIKFNDGAPPTLAMVRISEDAEVPERSSLGDTDASQWPISELSGQPADPWQEQLVFPLISYGTGGEVFGYVARGVVGLNAAKDLLGRFRWHPKRHQGLLPIVEIGSGTYQSRKFGPRPKPVLKIVDWVNPDGSPAPSAAPPPGKLPQKGSSAAAFNDELPADL